MLHHGKLNIAGPVCKESVAQPSFSHPFYWAPFILIGNWQ
jgi:CHAT domain-containing protein